MKAVQLGVLGVSGHFGLRLRIPLRDSSLIKLKALGSRSLEKSRSAAAEWGFETACGSYEEVLAHPEVEAVYIPLPNDSHAEWIRR